MGEEKEGVRVVLAHGELLEVRGLEDMADHTNPGAPGALVKCCLLAAGIVHLNLPDKQFRERLARVCGGGLKIELWSDLPQGSGLGTSSILAGAVLAALWTCLGASYTRRELVHAVLVVEQLLTTGGGWQDQVGGLHPGITLGMSPADHRVRVEMEQPKVDTSSNPSGPSKHSVFLGDIEARLLLLYTGKPRLAKNLLQNVIRNWYGGDSDLVDTFKGNHRLAGECWTKVGECDLEGLGSCLDRYWRIKKALAPGSEPAMVGALLHALKPYVLGASLAGAGGGGFLVALLKEPLDREKAVAAVRRVPGTDRVTFHAATVDREGVEVTVGAKSVEVAF